MSEWDTVVEYNNLIGKFKNRNNYFGYQQLFSTGIDLYAFNYRIREQTGKHVKDYSYITHLNTSKSSSGKVATLKDVSSFHDTTT